LPARAPEQLGPGDDKRLRTLSASFRLAASSAEFEAVHLPGPAFEPEEHRGQGLLDLLLDPRRGLWALLCLAAGFGAVHALTPGHGKTLVAAYLVGERGTVWHACLLGLVTTLTHTGAVLALAVGLLFLFPEAVPADVQSALGLVGGLLIAGLGFWLLLRRLSGGADHVHIGGGGHHHQPAGGEGGVTGPGNKVSVWGLIALGISGGIVPCWDAIAMLAFAISAQRLWLALPLLLAFSAGLAGVLIAVGVAVVYVKGFAGSRWGEGRFVRALPLASAVMVTALGLWLCYDSVHKDTPAATVARERP
jgi:nickel/cobalt exporter